MFATPNSVSNVLYEIEALRHSGDLDELSCSLLEMFCVVGWDDGFVSFERRELCRALGTSPADLYCTLSELHALGFITCRDKGRQLVAEVTALTRPTIIGTARICWWQPDSIELPDF